MVTTMPDDDEPSVYGSEAYSEEVDDGTCKLFCSYCTPY